MNNGLSKVDSSWRSILIKGVVAVCGGLIAVVVISISIFWCGEVERARLIRGYQVPSEFIENIVAKREGSVGLLMNGSEAAVCAIGGYGSANDLPSLNSKQRASIPKDKIPSEDLSWYLLFFDDDSVTRIYLIDSVRLEGDVDGGSGCINKSGYFVVRVANEAGGVKHVLSLSKREGG